MVDCVVKGNGKRLHKGETLCSPWEKCLQEEPQGNQLTSIPQEHKFCACDACCPGHFLSLAEGGVDPQGDAGSNMHEGAHRRGSGTHMSHPRVASRHFGTVLVFVFQLKTKVIQ